MTGGQRALLLAFGLVSALGAGRADAQGLHLIPGVLEIPSDTLQDLAIAAVDLPAPVIYYNPRMTRRFGPLLTEFFLAHEYGHIALRHTRSGFEGLPETVRDSVLRLQELEADCYSAARTDARARASSDAAIRFFTRLGPFRFDSEHPTGAQRAARILDCLPPTPRERSAAELGETGVETGPVSGELQKVRFSVATEGLGATGSGREVVLWIDGQRLGQISNMRFPTSIAVDRFGAGIHAYRMELVLFEREGIQQYNRGGTLVGRGYIAVGDGDSLTVEWIPGSAPVLVKAPD